MNDSFKRITSEKYFVCPTLVVLLVFDSLKITGSNESFVCESEYSGYAIFFLT